MAGSAVRLQPEFIVAHDHLGRALADRGDLDEAIDCFRRALQLRPDYAPARGNLERALQRHRTN